MSDVCKSVDCRKGKCAKKFIYLDVGRINGIGFQFIERQGNNLSMSAEISKRQVDQIRRPIYSFENNPIYNSKIRLKVAKWPKLSHSYDIVSKQILNRILKWRSNNRSVKKHRMKAIRNFYSLPQKSHSKKTNEFLYSNTNRINIPPNRSKQTPYKTVCKGVTVYNNKSWNLVGEKILLQ